jgi:hydroxypyruvate reductase
MIGNADELLEHSLTPELRRAREVLIELIEAAIRSADPALAIRRWVKVWDGKLLVGDLVFDLDLEVKRIVVVGGGKASGAMGRALEELLGERITGGVVNVPQALDKRSKIEFIEAGHPLPSKSGVEGAGKMVHLLEKLGPHDLAICLISGGGSALIPLPAGDLKLEDIQETTRLLLRCGATVQELNAIRKHLSAVKGGQMAKVAHPARIISLIISDVVGDRLDTIASGPTVPDQTTYKDALSVLERYDLLEAAPPSVIEHLEKGARGAIPETPKSRLPNVFNFVIASNADALKAAEKVGKAQGLNVHILTGEMEGEASEVGRGFSLTAREVLSFGKPVPRPALLLSGGETTVKVKGGGKGGRNQELALSAALGIGLENVAIASFSTDGIDGPTDAAGAIADGFTVQRAEELGLDPSSHLERNDSYHLFKRLGDLLITGPTGTNVMDMTAIIVL